MSATIIIYSKEIANEEDKDSFFGEDAYIITGDFGLIGHTITREEAMNVANDVKEMAIKQGIDANVQIEE